MIVQWQLYVHTRHVKVPVSVSTITRLIEKFEATKSLHDALRSGRPSLAESREDSISEALHSLQSTSSYGTVSSSAVARVTEIPERSVRRYLREHLGLYPYHLNITQEIRKLLKWIQSADLNFLSGYCITNTSFRTSSGVMKRIFHWIVV